MAEINWNLAQPHDIGGTFMNALLQGQKLRRETDSRNALGVILGGGQERTPGQTPGIGDGVNQPDPKVWGALNPEDRVTAMAWQKQQAGQQEDQRKLAADRMQQTGRLLQAVKADPSKYAQARQAAIGIGVPAANIPETYDPAWVDQQLMMASAFEKDGGAQISGLARELSDAGYKPGTPEFQQAMLTALQGKYAPTYTDQQGRMMQGELPPLPAQQPAQQPHAAKIIPQRPEGMADSALFAQAREAIRNGANADDVFKQLQAWGVQP